MVEDVLEYVEKKIRYGLRINLTKNTSCSPLRTSSKISRKKIVDTGFVKTCHEHVTQC